MFEDPRDRRRRIRDLPTVQVDSSGRAHFSEKVYPINDRFGVINIPEKKPTKWPKRLAFAGLGLAALIGVINFASGRNDEEVEVNTYQTTEVIDIQEPTQTITEAPIEQENLEAIVEEPAKIDLLTFTNEFLRLTPNYEDRELVQAVAENEDLIQDYVDVTGLPFALVASQLYVESKFDPNLRSTKNAYGLGQLTNVAYLETMYTVFAVPGGFNKEKKMELTQDNLANKRYTIQRESFFPELKNGENSIYNQLDVMVSDSTGFSTNAYMERTEERLAVYEELHQEYLGYISQEGDAHWNNRKKIREIRREKSGIFRSQVEDNRELRTALRDFWNTDVASHKGEPQKTKGGKILWYTLDPAELPEDFHDNLDLLTQLNMVREYGPVLTNGTNFDVHSDAMQTAILEYNASLDYLSKIQDYHDRIDNFLTLAEGGGKIRFD